MSSPKKLFPLEMKRVRGLPITHAPASEIILKDVPVFARSNILLPVKSHKSYAVLHECKLFMMKEIDPNYQEMTPKKIERQINILSKMKRENINF